MNRLTIFTRPLAAVALLAGACALLAPAGAHAQQYFGFGSTTLITGGTNNIAAGATNVYTNVVISPTRSEYLAFSVNYNFTVAPIGVTPTVTLRLQRSLDNSNWEATPAVILSPNGATNNVVWVTNIVAGSVPYYRVSGVENTNSSAVTNFALLWGVKR